MSKEGIKLDSDKPRIGEFLDDFELVIEPLTRIWEFGATTYGISNWKSVENGEKRFTNALFRHYFKEKHAYYDDETGVSHAAHVAFNALMRLWFIMQKPKSDILDKCSCDETDGDTKC